MKLSTLTSYLILFLQCSLIQAQEYHVAKNGDDDHSGSLSSPWESIQHAMDNATEGSTVYIHAGIYSEALYVNVSGTNGNYITFTNFENDEVIIDADGQTSTAVIEVYNVHHIAIENLIIRNHQRNDAVGILVEGACDHIRIDDCEIYNINFSSNPNAPISDQTNAHAIAVYGDNADYTISNLEILDNEIHDCRLGFSEALVVNGNVDGFIINDNEVYDVTNIGIDIIGHEGTCDDPTKDQARNGIISQNVTYNCLSPYATSAGIYVDGGKNLIIEQNEVYNNQWGIEIGCENVGKTTENIIVRNNLIYGNSTAGLAVGGYDYPNGSGKVSNVKILNNTLYGNDTEEDYTGELFLSYNENLSIFNNIFFGTASTGYVLSTEDLSPSLNVNIKNNNWYSSLGSGNEEYYYNGQDFQGIADIESGVNEFSDNLSTNPAFLSIFNNNFRLSTESEMIDQGLDDNDLGVNDFLGNSRKVGVVDIGAFEYDMSLFSDDLLKENKLFFPNPAIDKITVTSLEKGELKIYDTLGNLLIETIVQIGQTTVDVSSLIPGIYILMSHSFAGEKLIRQ